MKTRSDPDEAGEPGFSRRELMRLAAYAVALPGATEFFSAWLHAAPPRQSAARPDAPPEPPLLRDYRPQFFNREDFEALRAFTEILIPTDDTPGAREAHCAHFIDFVLQASGDAAPDAQKHWRRAMAALKETGFHGADAARRASIVAEMARPETERGAHHRAYFAYRLIKQENTFAFYTSRAGMIETLDYRGNSFNVTFPACTHPEHRAP
jgi:hypothetical protein